MVLPFDKIPSEVKIPVEATVKPTVEEKLGNIKTVVQKRFPKCHHLNFVRKHRKKDSLIYKYRLFCVCPRYCPNYVCKHAGNVIIDRDVLTKEEHTCYLAMPRENYAEPRKAPRYYQKRTVLPNCTARIAQLALPDLKRVRCTLEDFKHVLNKNTFNVLKNMLAKKPEVESTSINTALSYIDEERRLRKVAKALARRRCKRYKRNILCKQRCLIKTMICVIFEEMKDFLLNDQFLVDEQSTLGAVIFEQIRLFTDKDFYATTNLREYQQILANNITIWINKFLSNLNIHLTPQKKYTPNPEIFLPVQDYISSTDSQDEDQDYSTDFFEYLDEGNEGN